MSEVIQADHLRPKKIIFGHQGIHSVLRVFHQVDDASNAPNDAVELLGPSGHAFEVGVHLLLQVLKKEPGKRLRLLIQAQQERLVSVRRKGQQLGDHLFIGCAHCFRDGRRVIYAAAYPGFRPGDQETCHQPPLHERLVADTLPQHVRLHHQQDGQGRMWDVLRWSVQPVHPDTVPRVAFQEHVHIDGGAEAAAAEGVENAAFRGEYGNTSPILRQQFGQRFRRAVVRQQADRVDRLERCDLLVYLVQVSLDVRVFPVGQLLF